ncbi:YybH family protein [Lysobacter soli]|uniref:YybH family protein n=1 Tax=Lysobacter soli TaxID=453783 RepID=UPI0036B91DCB
MRIAVSLSAVVLLGISAVADAQSPPKATPKPEPARMTSAECEVWARELSFAQSVADHDAKAFASHIETDAAFGASQPQPTRGREEIARRWAGIVEGKRLKLSWYPTRTTIGPGSAKDVAWSSGPSLFEDLDPKSTQRYRIGAFHSVWHRGADGTWRVLFDDGVDPRPVAEAEATAFREGRQTTCPQA